MVQKSSGHQLVEVGSSSIIYKVLYLPGEPRYKPPFM